MTTQARLKRAENEINSLARKVLEFIPTTDCVDKKHALVMLKRQGILKPQSVIYGCLDTLVRHGLVKEEPKGHFVRITATPPTIKVKPREGGAVSLPRDVFAVTDDTKEKEENAVENTPSPDPKAEANPELRDPMDIIIELRETFEAAMYEIAAYYDAKKAEHDEDMDQLRHFKALMKSVNKSGD